MKRVYCLMILLLCATSVLWAQKKAEIEFKQTKYDFHEIAEENGDVSHIFTFINKGSPVDYYPRFGKLRVYQARISGKAGCSR